MSLDLLGKRVGIAVFLGLGLVLAGCADDPDVENKESEARILEFSADPETVIEGSSTTIRWSTEAASSVILFEDGIKKHPGSLPAEGHLEVTPSGDTTYELEVRGKDGGSVESRLEVSVESFGAPRIDSFSASPSVAGRGSPVTLSWEVVGADSLEITLDTGEPVSTIAPVVAKGDFELRPNDSATYVLRARNEHGTTTEEVEVTVGKRPSLGLALSSERAAYGEELTLSWTVADAESLTVFDPEGGVLHEGPASDGSLALQAERSGDYRATAIGLGGEAVAHAHLDVMPEVVSFEVIAQGSARPGAQAHASWSVRGAERIAISNGFEDVVESRKAEGSASVELVTGGSFILRAYSGSMMDADHAVVHVIEEPLIHRVSTGPLVTAGQGVAGMSTIGWEIDGAAKILLEVDPGGVVDVTDKSPRLDEVEVLFTEPGTVTLTAFNNAGSSVVVIDAPVDPVPIFDRFFAAPSRAGSGETVDLHWDVRYAERVVLEREGVAIANAPTDPTGVYTTEALAAPATYTLRAFNSLGHEAISEPLQVEIGAPNQIAFDTTDGQRLYRVNDQVEVVWENDGGKELTITQGGQVVHTTQDVVEIQQGSHTITMPSTQQDVPVLLEVTNSSGSDSRLLDLQAVTGPVILSFTTDVPEITDGDSLVFFWETQADEADNIPTLTLVDDRGVEYDLSDIEGEDALAGSRRFTVEGWAEQPRVFTLTAKTEVDPPYSLSTELMVYGIPAVDTMEATPPFAESEGDQVTFSWATTHGVELDLYNLAADGEAAAAPFYSTSDPSETAAGSAIVEPTIAMPNVRVVVRNPVGAETEADFRIGVDPATISSFTANGVEAPATIDILRGEEVTLAWETLRSDDSVLREEYIDISQHAGAIDLGVIGTGSTSKIPFNFPDDFVFPFDGETYSSVVIANSGYLTFEMSASASGINQNFPYTGSTANYRNVDIAPFWDSLRDAHAWAELIEGPVDRLIIQWSNVTFTSSTYQPADLNFQVVLFEDGRFELRYGLMSGAHQNARAASATIGAQSRNCSSGCTFGESLVYNTEQPNGLEGRVYRFEGLEGFAEDASTPVPMPEQGSLSFVPTETRSYVLKTWNGHSEHEESLEVRVHAPGRIDVWADPAEPLPGEAVDIHWAGANLTSLTIEDGAGNVVHTATASELESGSLALGNLAQGIHWYTVNAVGMLPYDQIQRELAISANDAFSLDAFSASETLVKSIELPVTLSWETTNATSATITELPSGTVTAIDPADLASGTLQVSPSATSTYVLEVESHERYRQAEVVVEVRTVWIDDFAISASTISAGGTVTLSWDTTSDGNLTIEPTGDSPSGGQGNIDLSPDSTTTYTLCIEDGDWEECREVTVAVVAEGDLQITEIMPAPDAGAPAWVEIRNLLAAPVDMDGWSLETTAGVATITGPLIVPAGGYVVLAEAQGTGLDADYIYGSLPMNPSSDTLELKWGTDLIYSMSWDASWNITSGQSLELDPMLHRSYMSSRDQAGEFCLPSESYDGTNLGTPGEHGLVCSPGGQAYLVDTVSTAPLFDISSSGITLLTSFQDETTVNLSFDFPFFGDTSDLIGVTSTGFAAIAAVDYDSTNDPLPTSGDPGTLGLIAPYWEYFSFSRLGATVAWEERTENGQQVAIFQWTDTSHWDGSSSDAIDFQLQLWENGDIVFGYTNLRGSSGYAEGKSTTIGLQEAGSSPRYLQYSYNEESVFDGQVIYFTKL